MHESSSNTTTPAPSQFGKTALAGFDEILQPIEEYPISKDKLKLLKLVVDILKLLSFILNGIKDKISGSNLNTARSYGTSNMKEFSCSAARIIAPFFFGGVTWQSAEIYLNLLDCIIFLSLTRKNTVILAGI